MAVLAITPARAELAEGGVGLDVDVAGGAVQIISVVDKFPAAKAGVRVGDIITAIDGKPVAGLVRSAIIAKLRGPVRSPLSLSLSRSGQAFEVRLVRASLNPTYLLPLMVINPTKSVAVVEVPGRAQVGKSMEFYVSVLRVPPGKSAYFVCDGVPSISGKPCPLKKGTVMNFYEYRPLRVNGIQTTIGKIATAKENKSGGIEWQLVVGQLPRRR